MNSLHQRPPLRPPLGILCQEGPYFQELVRYIHLNPLRAKLATGIGALDKYPYSGHSALMGMVKNEWQDTEYVLGWSGKGMKQGRSRYHDFMKEGVLSLQKGDWFGAWADD